MIAASGVTALTCTFRSSLRCAQRVSAMGGVRTYSTEPLPIPQGDSEQKVYSEKLHGIVSDISQLTLLEVSSLNDLLKKTLNISDAPVMPMGMMGMMAGGAQKGEEAEEASTLKEQTSFKLRITSFDSTKKVALIKHIKSIMEGMNLVQAKKFVENLPAIVRQDGAKEEVEKLQDGLKEVGAECAIE